MTTSRNRERRTSDGCTLSRMKITSGAVGALAALTLAGCTSSAVASGQPAKPVSAHMADHRFGATVRVHEPGTYVADVTVSRARGATVDRMLAKRGKRYLILRVTVRGVAGRTDVGGMNLAASSAAGDHYTETGFARSELATTTLAAGRVTRGFIAFAVPAHFHGAIEWDGLDGALAYWRA